MAQVQTPAVAAPSIRPASQSIVMLAIVSALLVGAIALALVASGTLTFTPSARAGDVGSPQWITFRAGERAPLPATRSAGTSSATTSVEQLQSRARAAAAMADAGIHGSLGGVPSKAGSAAPATSTTSANSAATVDFRRCERELC